ncbi:MAG: hypothetical protein ACRDQA_02160 [Nocardioidaceae bacterium]
MSGPTGTNVTKITQADVRLNLDLRVTASAQTRAFAAYVRAHAKSVIAGHPVSGLASSTSGAQLKRQRAVIKYTREKGYVVPPDPKVRVVTAHPQGNGRALLGACLWLPSTEYVDSSTGESVGGAVPQQWAKAVATLKKSEMTWVVDKVLPAKEDTKMNCGGKS